MVNKRYCQTLNENLHISRKLVQIWPNSGNARTGSILWISEIRVTSVFFRIENEKKNEMGNQVEFFFSIFLYFSQINCFPWNVIYFPNSAQKIHIFWRGGGIYNIHPLFLNRRLLRRTGWRFWIFHYKRIVLFYYFFEIRRIASL